MRPPRFAPLALAALLCGATAAGSAAEEQIVAPGGLGEVESYSAQGDAGPAGDPALADSRTRRILDQQLNPPPGAHVPGIGGPEAAAIYNGYLGSIGSAPLGDTYGTQD